MAKIPYEISSAIFSTQLHIDGIYSPVIQGAMKNVFVAKTVDDGDYVFKLNHKDLAIKNAKVSEIYNKYNIRVPEIELIFHKKLCFEKYKMVSGKTLFEEYHKGLTKEQIQAVYAEILEQFAKMSELAPADLRDMKYSTIDQVAYRDIKDSNSTMTAKAFAAAIKFANRGKSEDKALFHCGIAPKNIILNDKGNFNSFVDIDKIAMSDINYAFAIMAAKYKQLGFDTNELIDTYELFMGQKLDHKKIQFMINMNNFGKNLLWKSKQK